MATTGYHAKKLRLRPKLSYQNYVGYFRLGFENIILIFQINALEFCKMQSFMYNKKKKKN